MILAPALDQIRHWTKSQTNKYAPSLDPLPVPFRLRALSTESIVMQTEEEKEARRIGKNYRRIWNIAQHGMISGWEDWRNGQFVRKPEEEIAEVQRKLELAGQEMNSLSGNSLEWAKKAAGPRRQPGRAKTDPHHPTCMNSMRTVSPNRGPAATTLGRTDRPRWRRLKSQVIQRFFRNERAY